MLIENKKDAFGKYFQDIYKDKDTYGLVIERDDGYIDIDTYDYFSGIEYWPERQKKMLKYIHGKVLDIGCGPGSHIMELRNKGYDVYGIDNSKNSVDICKKRGLKNIFCVDIENIDKNFGHFDTFLMLGNNFGLMQNYKKSQNLFAKLAKISSQNAVIVAETMDPYKTTNKFHKKYHKENRKRGRMPGQIRVRVRYQIYKTDWFDYLLVSKNEMKKLVKNTVWTVDRFIDSVVGPGYIAILKKKKK